MDFINNLSLTLKNNMGVPMTTILTTGVLSGFFRIFIKDNVKLLFFTLSSGSILWFIIDNETISNAYIQFKGDALNIYEHVARNILDVFWQPILRELEYISQKLSDLGYAEKNFATVTVEDQKTLSNCQEELKKSFFKSLFEQCALQS